MNKGIDIPIGKQLIEFEEALWISKNRQFYGRVFRNERFWKISPEVWISEKEPAREVLKDFKLDAQCFFDVQPDDDIESGMWHEADVWIVFMVNLEIIYPALSRQAATEQVQRDVEILLTFGPFKSDALVRGFKSVEDYDWGDEGSADQARADMHPNYCFRIETKLKYQNTNC